MAANALVRSPVVITNFYDFIIENIKGRQYNLRQYAGKVLVIINIASFGAESSKVLQQMNDLQAKFGEQVAVLGFPCNQFQHSVSFSSFMQSIMFSYN